MIANKILTLYPDALITYLQPVDGHIYVNQNEILDWRYGSPKTTEQINAEYDAWLSSNEKPELAEAKRKAKLDILRIIDSFSAELFAGGVQAKLNIYKDKQALVHAQIPQFSTPDWSTITTPLLADVEWETRILNGLTDVGAVNNIFICETALDLFKTWWLNTYFADWLRAKSEALRILKQSELDSCSTEEEIDDVISSFYLAIQSLPVEFMTNEVENIITISGLQRSV